MAEYEDFGDSPLKEEKRLRPIIGLYSGHAVLALFAQVTEEVRSCGCHSYSVLKSTDARFGTGATPVQTLIERPAAEHFLKDDFGIEVSGEGCIFLEWYPSISLISFLTFPARWRTSSRCRDSSPLPERNERQHSGHRTRR